MRYLCIYLMVLLFFISCEKNTKTAVVDKKVTDSADADLSKPDGTKTDNSEVTPLDTLIRIEQPEAHEVIKSPLTIKGEARGYWYFEASFAVELRDKNDSLLATGIAQAEKDWMTEDFVPFSFQINFDLPDSNEGYLLFEKSNPSGLPEHAKSLKLPVKFR